ncbi:hypothetical protein [Helicobacter sp. T3_23-1056]
MLNAQYGKENAVIASGFWQVKIRVAIQFSLLSSLLAKHKACVVIYDYDSSLRALRFIKMQRVAIHPAVIVSNDSALVIASE